MIIDGHAHMGGEYMDLPCTLSTLGKLGIDHVVLSPADTLRPHPMPLPDVSSWISGKNFNFWVNRLLRAITPAKKHQKTVDEGNETVFNVSRQSEGRIIQFFWANPLKEGILDELEVNYEKWKFKGIKLHQPCHPFKIISPEFRQVAEWASARNLPVFIHLHSKKEIMDFIRVSSDFKAPFITGHLIGLELFILHKADVGDRVYFDISCPALVSVERIRKAIKAFGAERIVMGSDTPYGINNAGKIMMRIRSLNLSDQDREKIMGENLKVLISF